MLQIELFVSPVRRYILQSKPPEELPKEETTKFRLVGTPEEVIRANVQYISPGIQVRVKKYVTEKV